MIEGSEFITFFIDINIITLNYFFMIFFHVTKPESILKEYLEKIIIKTVLFTI